MMQAEAPRFQVWYDRFNRLAGDLYAGRYNRSRIQELAEIAGEVRRLAHEKRSTILAHNYVYPELQEVADYTGDSLGLSQIVARTKLPRVDFCGVWFMGETARIIAGTRSRIYMPDRPGCSLVEGMEHRWLSDWIAHNPSGIVISYVNSDARTKAMSHYVCTSGNAAKVLKHVAEAHKKRRILFLPDKYLGAVALAEAQVSPELVDIYDGMCHVHAAIDDVAVESGREQHPAAELLIHPECACVGSWLPSGNGTKKSRFVAAYLLSSEQMLVRARESHACEFLVGTEAGMVYRLRREIPEKRFYPLSVNAVCEFMKMNTLEKLLRSLREDIIEVRVDAGVRRRAQTPIRRMLAIH
jgi:quinolinate synthase